MNYDLLRMIIVFFVQSYATINGTLFFSVSKDQVSTLVKGPHT